MADERPSKRSKLDDLYTRALSEAGMQLSGRSSLKLPWEKGVYAEIFSTAELPPMPKLPMPANLPLGDVSRPGELKDESLKQVSEPISRFESAVYTMCLKKSNTLAGGRPTTDREAVLRRWLCVVGHNLAGSKVGEILEDEDADSIQTISDVFIGKSTSTLLKRVRFAAKMLKWATDEGTYMFPLRLSNVVEFFRSLESEGARAQCGETINFLIHVLGVHADKDLYLRPLIQGFLRGSRLSDKEIKQSRVLVVLEVLALEDLLADATVDPVDRYGAGVFLFQIYSRGRVSDIRNIHRFDVDILDSDGYLEARTMDHKNAKKNRGLGQSLVLVAPIRGLRDKPWGLNFLEVSKLVGIDLTKGHRGPLLPRLTPENTWSGEAISADETTVWLNGLLRKALGREVEPGLTSHGLKATTLAWMTKAGYDDKTCLILGHHSRGAKKSLYTYGRDVQAQPLRELQECLSLIKRQVFCPDSTRSGMFRENEASFDPSGDPAASKPSSLSSFVQVDAPEPECQDEADREDDQGVGAASSDGCGSDTTGSSGSSDEDVDDYEALASGDIIDKVAPRISDVEFDVYQNPKTQSLHTRARGSSGALTCGRKVEGMRLFTGRVYSKVWMCKQCEQSKPLRDAGSMAAFIDQARGKTPGQGSA